MARLYPLFSGSSGNSYFLGSKDSGILIDAGKNSKQICLALERCEISPSAVQGIFITHEHIDHIAALRVFASKFNTPCFATKETIRECLLNGTYNEKYPMYEINQGLQIADMNINFFNTPHDSISSIGFNIKTSDNKKFTFATDLGHLSEEVKHNLEGSDFCVIESNHDIDMLQNGDYPYHLKKRILSEKGHLSNKDCSEYLPKLHKTGVKRFLLAHLSSENNYPPLAFESAACSMTLAGLTQNVDYTLEVAKKINLDGKGIIF